MILNIVKIGNSQGIRIPKNLLKECGISGKVDVEVKNHNLFIKPVNTRKDWEKAFKKMHEEKDDKLIIEDNVDLDFVNGEWEW